MTNSFEPQRRDLPPRASRRNKANVWATLLEPLMTPANKGEWFEVRTYDKISQAASAAYDIRKKRNRQIPEGEWEAAARDGSLFVRYMGDNVG